MYVKDDPLTGEVFTQTMAQHFETQFEEGVDQTTAAAAIVAGDLALDLDDSRVFLVDLNEDIVTWTITNVPASRLVIVTLQLTADGTPRTVTIPASFHIPSSVPYTPTSTNGKRDRISLETLNGGADWDFLVCAQNL